MRIINTATQTPEDLNAWDRENTYSGLDSAITLECYEEMQPLLDQTTLATYEFSKALQGPCLEMRLRGVLVDQARKAEVIDEYYEIINQLETGLERIVREGIGMVGFNWNSPKDVQALLYGKMGIPPVTARRVPTTNAAALEKLAGYTMAQPIVYHILAMREIQKKIGVLRTEIDSDGRMRTSYNIAGTSTGRFSSSFSEFGTGGNLQNVEESLRSIFIADPGYKFAKCDAKSGESFVVGAIEHNLFGDSTYLDACATGDPHTAVARICWPELPWTGKLKLDKDIAERPVYRHYSYRFMCKKLGHGSNYGGRPETLATQTRLPISVVESFQPGYFRAFPAHKLWHDHVDRTIRKTGQLTSLTGRRRYFFGRRNSDDVFREAVAYDPQGSLADIVNRAMLRIWRQRYCILMFQDHDALTFMYPAHLEDEIIPRILSDLPETIPLKNSKSLTIPYDCKTGWNKGDYDARKNPDGLKDYTPGRSDTRQRTPQVPFLDRAIHRDNGRVRYA